MKKDPQNAMDLAQSVSGSVMPVLNTIMQQLATRPLMSKARAKRRGDRRRMLEKINEMLKEQTALLGNRIEQLRNEAESKFVERADLEELNRSLEMTQSRLQTAEEVERVNQYLEQQLRNKQELERKRTQMTLASEHKHNGSF